MNEQENITIENNERVDYIWLISCVLVTAIASFLRFFRLELKPLHHDEGVNGYFLTTLFRSGEYKYDPANYHGPDLYYIALAFTKAFGLNTLSIRGSVAVFGILTVVLAFFLKKYIGKTGSLFAALFLALSPGMVYISRYFIHEILFVFFSFGIVIAILFFIEKRKAGIGAIVWTSLLLLICFLPSALNLANVLGGENEPVVWLLRVAFFLVEASLVFFVVKMLLSWNEGQPVYLILAAASAVLLFATKETAFITVGTMAIAVVCVWLWRKINSLEDFARNRFWIFTTFNIIVLTGAVFQYKRLKEGFTVLSEHFAIPEDANQNFLFYSIIGLIGITIIAWLTFMFVNRTQIETEVSDDTSLTWTRFREKLTASNTWEFIIVKSGVGAAAIFFVWLFVRYAIEILMAWKADKTMSSALHKIDLTNVDFWILAVAFSLLAIAAAGWLVRRPQKFSTDFLLLTVVVIVVFLYVGALFFSSFFTYPEGLQKAFEAYAIWTKTGKSDHTQNGRLAYIRWGMIIESPLLILSALGTLIALYKVRHRFAMFVALWAFGLFAAYTLIPYKTPWLALSFLLPMCIIAGYAVNELTASKHIAAKVLGGFLAVIATGILAFQTYDLNFVRYDNDTMPYVYAHTRREFLDLIKQIEYYADKSGQGKQAKIEVISPDYWSMPWYMNDYPNALFQGHPVDSTTAEMIVAKKDEQDSEVVTRYAAHYKYVGEYPLRPGVDLVLLVRKDLAESDAKDIYSVFYEPVTVMPDDNSEGSGETKTP